MKTQSKRLTALQEATTARFDRVEVEPWRGGLRPDLVAYKATVVGGQAVERALVVEIRVAHKVGPEKVEELRRRGDSALEIDLSRVDRELDCDALAREILETAPRAWLVHRLIDASQAQGAVLSSEQARRLADLREDLRTAQALARRIPPRPMQVAERRIAEGERHRWLALGAPNPLTVPADDGAFTVEPLLWRKEALRDLAPWHPRSEPESPTPVPLTLDLEAFRARGWVKRAFLPETLPPALRSEHGMQAGDVLLNLRREVLRGFFSSAGGHSHPTWPEAAVLLLARRWEPLARIRDWLARRRAPRSVRPGAPDERGTCVEQVRDSA